MGDKESKAPVEPSANLARPSALKHGRSPQGTPNQSKTARVEEDAVLVAGAGGDAVVMAGAGADRAGGSSGGLAALPGIPPASLIPPLPGSEVNMSTLMAEIQRMNTNM